MGPNYTTKKLVGKVPKEFFAEGIDFYKDDDHMVYIMLTWKELKILIFNDKFEMIKTIDQPKEWKEGWGITHDPSRPNIFYVSDSRNFIFECDYLQDFKVVKTHTFNYRGKPMTMINELEWIDGKIWANVYY